MNILLFRGYEFASAFFPAFLTVSVLWKKHQIKAFRCLRPYENKKRHAGAAFWLVPLFLVYLCAVYHFTDTGTIYDMLRTGMSAQGETASVNLRPFSLYIDRTGYLLNILLFMPFGFLLPLIRKRFNCFWRIFLSGALFSILIESSQLLNVRATDVDDLIMNTAGALTGYVLLRLCCGLRKKFFRSAVLPERILSLCIPLSFAGRFFLYNPMGLLRILSPS